MEMVDYGGIFAAGFVLVVFFALWRMFGKLFLIVVGVLIVAIFLVCIASFFSGFGKRTAELFPTPTIQPTVTPMPRTTTTIETERVTKIFTGFGLGSLIFLGIMVIAYIVTIFFEVREWGWLAWLSAELIGGVGFALITMSWEGAAMWLAFATIGFFIQIPALVVSMIFGAIESGVENSKASDRVYIGMASFSRTAIYVCDLSIFLIVAILVAIKGPEYIWIIVTSLSLGSGIVMNLFAPRSGNT